MQLVLIINCFSMRICCLLLSLTLVFNYFQSLRCGTTGVVTFIRGNMLHVAWVGDSQVMLVRKGQAVELMKPHKPDREVCMICSNRACQNGSFVVTNQDSLSVVTIIGFNLSNCALLLKEKYRKPFHRDGSISVYCKVDE